MRKIFFPLFLVFLSYTAFCQQRPQPGGGNRPAMTGRMYGKIVDAKSGKAIEYASVQLLQMRPDSVTKQATEQVVAGMLTQPNGEFALENIPVMGKSKLKISIIGFKEITQDVSFDISRNDNPQSMMGKLDKDLGNIKVEIEDKMLENVTVTSSRPGLQLGIDRKIFNVDKNIVSAGGSAVDIMRNVPSLNVDIDGNVSLRNSTPQIFVDGRPTTLTLEQIPADAVESVEIITNPSAKFDASGGTAGILNIVLKKEKKVGYNGNLRVNADSRGMVGGGGDINLRTQKFNYYVSGMYNPRKSIATGTTTRRNLFDDPNTLLMQEDESTAKMRMAFVRGGLDYFLSNRTTLSGNVGFFRGKFSPVTESNIQIDSLYSSGTTSSLLNRLTGNDGEFKNMRYQLGFKHNFPKKGMELTADATYNQGKNENTNNIGTNYFTLPGNSLIKTEKQRQISSGSRDNLIFQTDYANPFSENSKIEMGARAEIQTSDNSSSYFSYNGSQWLLDAGSDVNYKSRNNVYAAYGIFSNKIKKFGYQIGLRAESSDYLGEIPKTGERFDIKFPVSLFPSIFLSQQIGEDQNLQLNYSRRINRPGFWQLTPFVDSTDKLNPSIGNAGLKPEFTNSFELSYDKTFKNRDNFLASVYYKQTTDLITRYQVIENENVLNTYINANSSYVTGFELTSRNKLSEWWELTSNVNLYTSDIKIDDATQSDQERITSWFGKVNNNFKIVKRITLQLSGDYQSKTILPPGGSGSGGGRGGFGGGGMMFGGASASQGYMRPNYGVDVAIRYDFLKNKNASVSLNMNDILRTRRQDIHSASAFFSQDVFRRRDPQVLRINLSWRFGKQDPNLFKRKNMRSEQQGMDTGMPQ